MGLQIAVVSPHLSSTHIPEPCLDTSSNLIITKLQDRLLWLPPVKFTESSSTKSFSAYLSGL